MPDIRTLAECQAWLESAEPAAELTRDEATALRELFGHPGLHALLRLMLGSRQGFYVQLAALPLNSNAAVANASVLQGQIRGIDILRDTLLEQVTPSATPEEQN